ncbi:PAS domain S-box-containing protein/diguanylate cyclase (GGDEF)-like protein [Tepidimonas ignava]|uniref:PAS domain S-box-containing protein/diguanylate cyclase (GGDEF)-like protein n=1 Tax=Tepidimonas ignava TaxID=114249 RepID=A0A4R3LHX5_9BURK|nr:PAS domain S-box-containing protein/diguanylate cyclase (GGDEF)-like protein [Tepidimonas ignava]TSE22561.1 putative signaling protein [Tepidimonas ignava]
MIVAQRPRWLFRSPIRQQLFLLVGATFCAGVLLLSVWLLVLMRWAETENQKRLLAVLQPLLTGALVAPMIERDYASVRETAQALVESAAIQGLTIYTTDGNAVVEAGSLASGTADPSHGFALQASGAVVGRVEVRFSALPLQELWQRTAYAMLGGAIVVLLSGLWVLRAYAQALAARLARLRHTADAIAAGQLDARCDDRGNDEIGRLAADFNHMARRVEHEVRALSASRGEVQAILQSIGDGLIATDRVMRITYLNPVAEALTGWSAAEATGQSIANVLRLENALTGEPAEIPVGRVIETGKIVGLANHTVLIARDGRRLHIADSAAPVRDAEGELFGVVMVFRDVSEAYQLRADLEAERTRLALALKGADLGLWDRDLTTDRLVVDQRWAAILGYALDEIPTRDTQAWEQLVHPDDLPIAQRALQAHLRGDSEQYEAEFRMRSKRGGWRWILSRGRVTARAADGRPLRITGTHLDVTERREALREIEQLAFYDPLTGLANRRLLLDRLGRALASAQRDGCHGGLLFVDLDHFKKINDGLGHGAGDAVLREVAQRLQQNVRETDTAARMGGDEFLVLLPELDRDLSVAASAARRVADKLAAVLAQPYALPQSERLVTVTTSIGIALFPDREADAETLLRRADTAMYRAKAEGRSTVRFFEPSMQAESEARLALEADLREALQTGQFRLYLQPQCDPLGRVVGAEALLRWQHPKRGWVPPAAFIWLAESSGLIDDIGQWVLGEATQWLARCDELGVPLRIAVNISPRQFVQPDFPQRVRQTLAHSGADAGRLVLEITENVLLHDPAQAAARMIELKALGVRFSIDDFGTGYSSLAYLKRLPLSEIKIDRSFIAGLPDDSNDAALTKTILLLAQEMELEVVAEGVETESQLEWLRTHGCRTIQGYLLGRPEPAGDLIERLQRASTDPAPARAPAASP